MEEEWGICATGLRNAIPEVLGAFRDPRVIDALIKALGSDYHTAYAAAESLKKLRDRRAVEPLIRRLEDKRGGGYHREFPAQILGVLGDPRAIPALVNALRDGSIFLRRGALESLRRFIPTHPDAILRLPPDDRHLLGRLIQDAQRNELLHEVCE
jgi:HEAT repeat protein